MRLLIRMRMSCWGKMRMMRFSWGVLIRGRAALRAFWAFGGGGCMVGFFVVIGRD